jgi:hypothetical protein
MKKLKNTGFAHLELVVILAVVLAIGAMGGIIMLRRSHAAIIGDGVCGSNYNLIDTKDMYFPGYSNPQATLKVYYNQGVYKKCALLQAKNAAYGVSKPMTVRADWNTRVGKSYSKKDSGSYKYYAGPVYIDQSNIRSLTVKGTMTFKGTTKSVSIFY